MESVEMTKCPVLKGEKWYYSDLKRSTVLEVEFNNGQHNRYAGDKMSKIGDLFVVGPGFKSSYALGKISSVATSPGKTGRLAGAVMSFRRDPNKSEIKKCYDGIKPVKTMENIKALLPEGIDYGYEICAEELVLSDILTCNVLRALSVLAFPELAPDYMKDAALAYISEEKVVPDIMFGSSMNKLYDGGFIQMAFSGYYPEWQKEFQALPVWKEDGILSEEKENFLYEENGLLIYEVDGSSKIKSTFKNNKEFNEFFNKLIYKSAFALMIRGGMLNLLQTALSVQMPIKGYYEEIVALSEQLDVPECKEILKSVDYTKATFDKRLKKKEKTSDGKSAKSTNTKIISDSKAFTIDGNVLVKYKGNDETVIVPDGIKVIEKAAFRHSTVRKVVLPESVTQIKTEAFYNCEKLETFVFSQNLTSIGNGAFNYCKGLISADLGMTKIKTINTRTFECCNKLSEIILPKNLVKIDSQAFSIIGDLVKMVIPATVNSIAYNAFDYTTVNNIILEGDKIDDVHFLGKLKNTPNVYCKKDSELWLAISDYKEEVDETNKKYPMFGGHSPATLFEL